MSKELSKEMEFFIYLIENYAYYKNKNAKEVMETLKGIPCGGRGTSCPNEVSKAIEEYYSK